MNKKKKNFLSTIAHSIWSLFLTGLFALLPMTLTIAVFTLTFRLLHNWLTPLRHFNLPFLGTTPYSELILAIAIIFIAGALYNIFILRPIIHAIENLVFRIPLVRPIYSGIKKLVEAFSFQNKISFSKVVLVEFPRSGIYSIGFLANELDKKISPNPDKIFYNIFIPTTPNPTSGFLVILPKEDVTIIDISRQEAMAMIISGGIIQPDIDKEEEPQA